MSVTNSQLSAVVAIVVTGVWAIIGVADLLIGDYTGLTISTPVMLLVVGAVLGIRAKNGAKH